MKVRRRNPRQRSPGFTLVELLMVIAIIALLLATLVPVVASLFGMTRHSATKATVKKLHEIMQKRQDAFERGFPEFFRQKNPFGASEYQPANWRHILFRKQKFREMFQTDTGIAINSRADSAEVLYRLVTEMPTFGTSAADAGQFNAAEIGDTDGDGVMEFIDSWGRPIVYYLYPTRLVRPGGAGSSITPAQRQTARYVFRSLQPNSVLMEDQDDPYGVLITLFDINNNGTFQSNEITLLNQFETNFHTFSTYHVPLIVSAGPDGLFGLYPPENTANDGYLAAPNGNDEELHDNITNHNITAGAQ